MYIYIHIIIMYSYMIRSHSLFAYLLRAVTQLAFNWNARMLAARCARSLKNVPGAEISQNWSQTEPKFLPIFKPVNWVFISISNILGPMQEEHIQQEKHFEINILLSMAYFDERRLDFVLIFQSCIFSADDSFFFYRCSTSKIPAFHKGQDGLEILEMDQNDMGVSKNNGTPKSSILIGFSIINHPFWGTPILGNTIWNSKALTMRTWWLQRYASSWIPPATRPLCVLGRRWERWERILKMVFPEMFFTFFYVFFSRVLERTMNNTGIITWPILEGSNSNNANVWYLFGLDFPLIVHCLGW